MTRDELGKAIYEKAYITGKFLLRSGKISNEYFDKYRFEAAPEVLNAIAVQLSGNIHEYEFNYIAALEMGGIPIATVISQITGKELVFVRKSAKEYGTKKFAEGPEISGKKLLIVEDVVTSGGQIIKSTNELRQEGAVIEKALCVIDRESGGKENLAQNNIELISLFTMNELKALQQVL